MRNLLRISLHDALDYEESKDLVCKIMDFRGCESKVNWFSNRMDVNFAVILIYKNMKYEATRYGFSLFCRNSIVHLENVSFFICLKIYI